MTRTTPAAQITLNYLANPKVTQCAYAVAAGEVIAYPTEAVWGLGCDPFDAHAVNRILQLKNRAASKGVILIAGDMAQLHFLLHDLSAQHKQTLNESWPGANTWLIPHHNRVPSYIHGAFDTVAVRVTAHPAVKALCHRLGHPIVSTSANPQGLKPASNQLKARTYFKHNRFGHSVYYCPGNVSDAQGQPSQIRHLITGDIVRA
ncbi:MAG TPA: Sua5/YciO/YrdC/YwlC family protein [Marinagarivorans sp.]